MTQRVKPMGLVLVAVLSLGVLGSAGCDPDLEGEEFYRQTTSGSTEEEQDLLLYQHIFTVVVPHLDTQKKIYHTLLADQATSGGVFEKFAQEAFYRAHDIQKEFRALELLNPTGEGIQLHDALEDLRCRIEGGCEGKRERASLAAISCFDAKEAEAHHFDPELLGLMEKIRNTLTSVGQSTIKVSYDFDKCADMKVAIVNGFKPLEWVERAFQPGKWPEKLFDEFWNKALPAQKSTLTGLLKDITRARDLVSETFLTLQYTLQQDFSEVPLLATSANGITYSCNSLLDGLKEGVDTLLHGGKIIQQELAKQSSFGPSAKSLVIKGINQMLGNLTCSEKMLEQPKGTEIPSNGSLGTNQKAKDHVREVIDAFALFQGVMGRVMHLASMQGYEAAIEAAYNRALQRRQEHENHMQVVRVIVIGAAIIAGVAGTILTGGALGAALGVFAGLSAGTASALTITAGAATGVYLLTKGVTMADQAKQLKSERLSLTVPTTADGVQQYLEHKRAFAKEVAWYAAEVAVTVVAMGLPKLLRAKNLFRGRAKVPSTGKDLVVIADDVASVPAKAATMPPQVIQMAGAKGTTVVRVAEADPAKIEQFIAMLGQRPENSGAVLKYAYMSVDDLPSFNMCDPGDFASLSTHLKQTLAQSSASGIALQHPTKAGEWIVLLQKLPTNADDMALTLQRLIDTRFPVNVNPGEVDALLLFSQKLASAQPAIATNLPSAARTTASVAKVTEDLEKVIVPEMRRQAMLAASKTTGTSLAPYEPKTLLTKALAVVKDELHYPTLYEKVPASVARQVLPASNFVPSNPSFFKNLPAYLKLPAELFKKVASTPGARAAWPMAGWYGIMKVINRDSSLCGPWPLKQKTYSGTCVECSGPLCHPEVAQPHEPQLPSLPDEPPLAPPQCQYLSGKNFRKCAECGVQYCKADGTWETTCKPDVVKNPCLGNGTCEADATCTAPTNVPTTECQYENGDNFRTCGQCGVQYCQQDGTWEAGCTGDELLNPCPTGHTCEKDAICLPPPAECDPNGSNNFKPCNDCGVQHCTTDGKWETECKVDEAKNPCDPGYHCGPDALCIADPKPEPTPEQPAIPEPTAAECDPKNPDAFQPCGGCGALSCEPDGQWSTTCMPRPDLNPCDPGNVCDMDAECYPSGNLPGGNYPTNGKDGGSIGASGCSMGSTTTPDAGSAGLLLALGLLLVWRRRRAR